MRLALLATFSLLAVACSAQPPADQVESVATDAGPISVVEVASGLDHPWGLAFLPDGRMLVTERAGRLRIVTADGDVSAPVAGLPAIYAQGQGGLLDVALAPDFETSGHVYLAYAKPGDGPSASTALGRAVFQGDSLAGWEDLFVQEAVTGPNHFGGRIAFLPSGHLVLSTGDRFKFDPAQDLSDALGALVRLNPDGSVPDDNPFVGEPGAQTAIWSYGHRNVQSLAVHPQTGELWEAEFGPLGGDELNRIARGANYGWPEVSWGRHYNGGGIPDPPTRPEFTDAVMHWTPVISPSGMDFYTGDVFPDWAGSLLIASLSKSGIVRIPFAGGQPDGEELIPLGSRIREVAAGPDGLVYALTDASDGAVWRIQPLETE